MVRSRVPVGAVVSCVVIVALAAGIIVAVVVHNRNAHATVTTTTGTLRGASSTNPHNTSQTVHEFFNIRYAEPPIGDLRFQPPVPLLQPDAMHDVSTEAKVKCIQHDTGEGQEDCLMLTVRSPDLDGSRPVIVWIHGGGLLGGHCCEPGYTFDLNTTLLLDVVTVNVNYRLGFLGFGSISELWESGSYPNNGIRDQIAALEWVQENIAAFGGDPTSVTVVGHSGGATAVLGLVSSPLALNMFQGAVALSPATEMKLTVAEADTFQRRAFEMPGAVGCTTRRCLLDTPASWFSAATPTGPGKMPALNLAYFDFPLRMGADAELVGLVVIDPDVVTQSPRDLARADHYSNPKTRVLVSGTAEETGIMHVDDSFKVNAYTNMTLLRQDLIQFFSVISDTDPEVLEEQVTALYSSASPQELWDLLTTDLRSTCPMDEVARSMSTSDHHTLHRLYISNSQHDSTAFHAWDTYALFGFTGWPNLSPTSQDQEFRNSLVTILRDFANNRTEGWGVYPDTTLFLGNSELEMRNQTPQETQCNGLKELELLQYGWQN